MEASTIKSALLFFLENRGIVTVSLLVIIFSIYAIQLYRSYSDIPPGPWGLPIFGYSLFLSKEPYKDFIKMGKRYGDVFSVGIGSDTCIILNSYKSIKDGFMKSGGALDGRAKDGFSTDYGENKMVLFTDGEIWRSQRRFLLSAMKDYGLDKIQLEEYMQSQAENAVDMILETIDKPFDLGNITYMLTANGISYFILGHAFTDESQHVLDALKALDKHVNNFSPFSPVNAIAGIMQYIPQHLTGVDVLYDSRKTLYDFTDKLANEHKKTYNENHMRDLIDVYQMKLNDTVQHGQEASKIYTTSYLRANVTNLFMAGSETSATLLTWSLKVLAAHPQVQKRVQSEIDEIAGSDRHLYMEDLNRMPYTEAVMLEIQRYITIVPVTPIGHRVTDDVMLNGYQIPKDSLVAANFWSVHYDPDLWKNPEKFDPERFLDENGVVIGKLREYVMTFSIGKRRCLGETLAKIEYFLILTGLLQKLTFSLPEGEKWPFEIKIHVPVRKCKKTEICAKRRSNN